MKTKTILKLNIAKQGYSYIPSLAAEFNTSLDLDRLLPKVDETNNAIPQIAYSICWLNQRYIALTIGCYWADKPDEFGRLGLNYWHIEICETTQKNKKELFELSEILLNLLSKYEKTFHSFGDFVANAAIIDSIQVKLASEKITNNVTELNKLSKQIVYSISKKTNEVSQKSNLKASFPFDHKLEAITLLCIIYESEQTKFVGGGNLSKLGQEKFDFVATQSLLNDFSVFEINKLFEIDLIDNKFEIQLNDLVKLDESTILSEPLGYRKFISQKVFNIFSYRIIFRLLLLIALFITVLSATFTFRSEYFREIFRVLLRLFF